LDNLEELYTDIGPPQHLGERNLVYKINISSHLTSATFGRWALKLVPQFNFIKSRNWHILAVDRGCLADKNVYK